MLTALEYIVILGLVTGWVWFLQRESEPAWRNKRIIRLAAILFALSFFLNLGETIYFGWNPIAKSFRETLWDIGTWCLSIPAILLSVYGFFYGAIREILLYRAREKQQHANSRTESKRTTHA